MSSIKKLNQSDILGVAASGLCALHCAVTPLFFAAKPIFESTHGHHHDHTGVWGALDYLFLVVSLAAVWYSARHTSHRAIKWTLWTAWVVFALGLAAEPLEIKNGIWLMYAGSIALVIAHLKNHHHCKKCKNGSCS